jgi:hypothetical protein
MSQDVFLKTVGPISDTDTNALPVKEIGPVKEVGPVPSRGEP